jgi:hypothetical protein
MSKQQFYVWGHQSRMQATTWHRRKDFLCSLIFHQISEAFEIKIMEEMETISLLRVKVSVLMIFV